MARHAGFAVAATVGEGYLNQTLWAAFMDLEPVRDSLVFALPSTVPIGGGTVVQLSGVALFDQRPTVTLAPNPSNTVRINASAVAFVSAAIAPDTISETDQTWRVRLSAAVDVAVDAEIDQASDGVYLRWLPSGSTITDLTVTVLEGPGVPGWLVTALNSSSVHASMTQALHAVGPVRVTGKLLPRRIQHTQAGDFKETNFSVFQWFSIDETVSRVELRVMNGSIAIGADLAGRSNGDPNQLVDLIQQVGSGSVYRWPIFDTTLSGDRPLVVGVGAKVGAGDIAVLFNPDVMSAIAAGVSAQITGTPIAKKVTLTSIAVRPSGFEKPLRGHEFGLRVDFAVHHADVGDVTGQAYLQPYLRYDAEPGPDPFPGSWLLYVGHVEIDVPWWLDFAVALAGVTLTVCAPYLGPLFAVGVIALADGIIPSVVSNVEEKAARTLKNGTLLAPQQSYGTLPTAKQQTVLKMVNRIHVNDDGLGLVITQVASDVRFAPQADIVDVASLVAGCFAGSVAPYSFAVSLRPDLAALAPDCRVRIVVRRADTGATVGESDGPLLTSGLVTVDHMNPDLFLVDQFEVDARIWISGPSHTGLLWATTSAASVTDVLDRHHPFLTWSPHWAHFQNAGTAGKWWHRLGEPTLHRTAPARRCLAVRQRVERLGSGPFGVGVDYVDTLPFAWNDLDGHRRELCEYCFFNGPEKHVPTPQPDWQR